MFTIIHNFHIEFNHTLEEYNALYGVDYENGDLWDFTIEDVVEEAIEGNPNLVYWGIVVDHELRIFETYEEVGV